VSVPPDENAIPLNGKPVDLATLQAELSAGGITVNGLMLQGDDLYMMDAVSVPIVPTPEAIAVVDAHVAPPAIIEYAGVRQASGIARTTDDQPTEVFRIHTEQRHIYRATLRITAVDATSGATKDAEARMVFKRPTTTVVQVGALVPLSTIQDTAASSWQIQPGVSGDSFTISVKGAIGRTIDWLLTGEIVTYAPQGLSG
jgi:hypothetical protein